MLRRPSLAALALALAAVLLTPLASAPAIASDPARDRSCGWILEPSADRENILFPDFATRYLGAAVPIPPGASIELTGQFPHARYMSFNLYNPRLEPLDALADVEIVPNAGSSQPFAVGANRQAEPRDYHVRVVAGMPPALAGEGGFADA